MGMSRFRGWATLSCTIVHMNGTGVKDLYLRICAIALVSFVLQFLDQVRFQSMGNAGLLMRNLAQTTA